MGITIECKKTGMSYDMGYGGFGRFRDKVAMLYNKKLGNHFAILSTAEVMFSQGEKRKDFFKNFNKETDKIIEDEKLSNKVINFLCQCDCEGDINYGTCKIIYNFIKDYNDDICYGYSGREDCTMFADMKALFKECYENKSKMVWH